MIEKFCKKADKTKAELSELLNNKNTQNDTLEKLVIFISNFNKKCIISTFDGYSEKGKIGKQFLGFEHSERKKYEGIRPFPNNEDGVIRSQLYTDENVFDDKKVNYYFYNAFLGEFPEVHENLKDNVKYANINNLFNFEKKEFDYAMNTKIRPRQEIENGVELKELCEFIGKGKRPASFENQSGNIDFIVSSFEKKKCLKADFNGEYLVIGDGGKANMHYLNGEFSASDHTYILRQKSQNVLLKYIYVYLMCNLHVINNGFTGLGIKNVSKSFLEKIQIQLTPLSTQQEIIDKFDEIEWKQNENKKKITSNNDKIFEVIEGVGEKEEYNLNEFCKDYYAGGDAPENYTPTKTEQNQIPIYSNGIENDGLYGYTNKARCLEPAITISARGTIGFVALRIEPFFPIVRLITLIPNTEIVDVKLLYYIMQKVNFNPNGKTIKQLTIPQIQDIKILIPSLETQHKLLQQINQIEKENEELKREIEALEQQKKEFLDKYLK